MKDADAPDGPPAFERLSAVLRDEIIGGTLRAGDPLTEQALAQRFDHSRNTIREALRCLHGDGLLQYERHRGVSVRRLLREDVHDIYLARRLLQLQAIGDDRFIGAESVAQMEAWVARQDAAAAKSDWSGVGTASLRFHQSMVALHGSPRIERFFASLSAQLRLAFASAPDEARFQKPWVERDRHLVQLIANGPPGAATKALSTYLEDSERLLLSLF